ncbi:hypothetical protein AB4Y45_36510 [Paraburkholderia sp. EG287A]|uniref:hypothetical protein n=1 Tax=unclassified Paraburkholderia TaxID=2615204 RepID=UPI0034D20C3B
MTGIVREVRDFLFVEKRRDLRRFFPLSDPGGLASCSIWEKGRPLYPSVARALRGFCRWRWREPSESLVKSPDTRKLTRAALRQAG